jgi:hypothetical protein
MEAHASGFGSRNDFNLHIRPQDNPASKHDDTTLTLRSPLSYFGSTYYDVYGFWMKIRQQPFLGIIRRQGFLGTISSQIISMAWRYWRSSDDYLQATMKHHRNFMS